MDLKPQIPLVQRSRPFHRLENHSEHDRLHTRLRMCCSVLRATTHAHYNMPGLQDAYEMSGVLADSVGVFAVTFNFFGSGLATQNSRVRGPSVGRYSQRPFPTQPTPRSHRHIPKLHSMYKSNCTNRISSGLPRHPTNRVHSIRCRQLHYNGYTTDRGRDSLFRPGQRRWRSGSCRLQGQALGIRAKHGTQRHGNHDFKSTASEPVRQDAKTNGSRSYLLLLRGWRLACFASCLPPFLCQIQYFFFAIVV